MWAISSALSSLPQRLALLWGKSASFALSIEAINGFNGSLQLSYNPNVNGRFANGVQCVFSPQSPTFDATGRLNPQLTVTLTARPASVVVQSKEDKNAGILLLCFSPCRQPCCWD